MRHDLGMRLKLRSASINLPFGIGGVTVDVSEAEARAAWHLYVEFATRIVSERRAPGAGSAREALDSLYSLFATTRQVLREAGPDIARQPTSLGPLAISVLNRGIRPFVEVWHLELLEPGQAQLSGERRAEFDRQLAEVQAGMTEYMEALARVAGISRP